MYACIVRIYNKYVCFFLVSIVISKYSIIILFILLIQYEYSNCTHTDLTIYTYLYLLLRLTN